MYRIALSRRKGWQESSAPGDWKAGPGPKVKTRIAQAVDIGKAEVARQLGSLTSTGGPSDGLVLA